MDILSIITILIIISAGFSYLNERFVKLPEAIGVMTMSVVASIVVLIIGRIGYKKSNLLTTLAHNINFSEVLLNVMLGLLLFASALHFDYQKLKALRRPVLILSTLGVLAYRRKLGNEQATIFDNNGYRYSAIVTSDTQAAALDVIEFYNHRDCEGEHHFKELDYDFSWNKLPFNNFQLNTIYLYATAIAYILFGYIKQKYTAVLDFVNNSMRLKNFVLHFVTLIAKWIKSGRQWIFKIFTSKDYSPLWTTT